MKKNVSQQYITPDYDWLRKTYRILDATDDRLCSTLGKRLLLFWYLKQEDICISLKS